MLYHVITHDVKSLLWSLLGKRFYKTRPAIIRRRKALVAGGLQPEALSPNVLKVLVEKFNIQPISTPEADMRAILKIQV